MIKDWLIFTSCGVTFEERAKTAAQAIGKSPARGKEFEIVAVVLSDAVVKPGALPITAFIVGNKAAQPPAPEGYGQ